jgi:hypothetical protein
MHVLNALIWILGIRGHIPQSGDFIPAQPSFGAHSGALMRILILLVTVALLSPLLWAAIWLAIKLL